MSVCDRDVLQGRMRISHGGHECDGSRSGHVHGALRAGVCVWTKREVPDPGLTERDPWKPWSSAQYEVAQLADVYPMHVDKLGQRRNQREPRDVTLGQGHKSYE